MHTTGPTPTQSEPNSWGVSAKTPISNCTMKLFCTEVIKKMTNKTTNCRPQTADHKLPDPWKKCALKKCRVHLATCHPDEGWQPLPMTSHPKHRRLSSQRPSLGVVRHRPCLSSYFSACFRRQPTELLGTPGASVGNARNARSKRAPLAPVCPRRSVRMQCLFTSLLSTPRRPPTEAAAKHPRK